MIFSKFTKWNIFNVFSNIIEMRMSIQMGPFRLNDILPFFYKCPENQDFFLELGRVCSAGKK